MLLAVDGGGTKTHVLLAEDNGVVLAQGKSGALSLTVVSQQEALKNLLDALTQAKKIIKRIDIVIDRVLIGMAGVDTRSERILANDFFKKALKPYIRGDVTIVNDTKIALASGSQAKNAIVLIAGTGANCYGYNEARKEAQAGGLDYFLADEGSAYSIGHHVIRAAIKSADGRGEKSVLEAAVLEQFKVTEMSDLKIEVYGAEFNKKKIAKLAMLASLAQNQNDQVARQIMDQATNDLIDHVKAVANRLHFAESVFDLVIVGGMFRDEVLNMTKFNSDIKKRFPQVNIIQPHDPPVYGALRLLVGLSKKQN